MILKQMCFMSNTHLWLKLTLFPRDKKKKNLEGDVKREVSLPILYNLSHSPPLLSRNPLDYYILISTPTLFTQVYRWTIHRKSCTNPTRTVISLLRTSATRDEPDIILLGWQ